MHFFFFFYSTRERNPCRTRYENGWDEIIRKKTNKKSKCRIKKKVSKKQSFALYFYYMDVPDGKVLLSNNKITYTLVEEIHFHLQFIFLLFGIHYRRTHIHCVLLVILFGTFFMLIITIFILYFFIIIVTTLLYFVCTSSGVSIWTMLFSVLHK